MEPHIQHAQTTDGVRIAFWTLGEGLPFVLMPAMFSHVQLEWQYPDVRPWYERLARGRMLVRYDGRGGGLSERNVTDYSLDARILPGGRTDSRSHRSVRGGSGRSRGRLPASRSPAACSSRYPGVSALRPLFLAEGGGLIEDGAPD